MAVGQKKLTPQKRSASAGAIVTSSVSIDAGTINSATSDNSILNTGEINPAIFAAKADLSTPLSSAPVTKSCTAPESVAAPMVLAAKLTGAKPAGSQQVSQKSAAGVHDLVQDVVSDLDSVLSFVINLRFGLDGSHPCSHEEIASHLNANLKECLREKLCELLAMPGCDHISADQVAKLEAKAQRALCRRRVSQ